MSLNFPSPTQTANPYGMPQQQPPAAPVTPPVDAGAGFPGAGAMGQDSFVQQGAQDPQQLQALLQQLGGAPQGPGSPGQGMPGMPGGSQQPGAQPQAPGGGGQMIQQGDMVLETGNNFGPGGSGLGSLYSKENLTSWKGLATIGVGMLALILGGIGIKRYLAKAGEKGAESAVKILAAESHAAQTQELHKAQEIVAGLSDKLAEPKTEQVFSTLRNDLNAAIGPLKNVPDYVKDVAEGQKLRNLGNTAQAKIEALFKLGEQPGTTYEVKKEDSKEPIQHISAFLDEVKKKLDELKPAEAPTQ